MRTRAASIATTTGSALLVAVVPAALVHLGASPTPNVPSTAALQDWLRQPLTAGFLAGLAQTGAWLIWALLVTAVSGRAYTRVTRALRWLPTLHLPGPLQGLTAAVLGATAVSASTGAIPAHAAAPANADMSDSHEAVHPTARQAGHTLASHAAASSTELARVATGREDTYTVKRGDTLSEIAERCLGDPRRWPDIFALNRGTRFPGVGGTLRNPNLIYPGWTLNLPAHASPDSPPRDAKPPKAPPTDQPDVEASQPPPDGRTPAPGSSAPATVAPNMPASTTTAAPPSSGVPEPAPTATGSAANADAGDAPTHDRDARGVSLPSGSWVDIGLALAIAGAVALVWAHRQRRYIPRPPTATTRTTDPDLAPMPPVIGQIRRGLRRLTAGHANAPTSDAPHTITEVDVDTHPEDLAVVIGALTESAGNGPDLDTCPGPDEPSQADAHRETTAAVDMPVVPSLANPLSALWPPAGLGLTGPGAHAAARGFLTAALAAGGLHDPDARTEVVMPSPTAATLLGAAAVNLPRTPRLTITTGLDEALEILEARTMRRTRLVDRHEVDTVADLRHTDPYEEPQPPIMLLADVSTRHERARVAALLAQGQRLDIHGVLLGPWPDGNTVMVADDGVATPAHGESQRPGRHPADVGRLAILTPAETAGLLAALAESHTGLPQPAAPTEPAPPPQRATPTPAAATTPTDTPVVAPPDTDADAEQNVQACHDRTGDTDSEQALAGAVASTDVSVSAQLTAAAREGGGAPPPADPTTAVNHRRAAVAGRSPAASHHDVDPEPTTQPARVRVKVLGVPTIVDGDPQRSLRAKSLELLVYLAVRDGSASTEAILDDLLPDAPASKAVHRLHTYVSDLRGVLRHNGGPGTYLTHPHRRYELNPERFDVDLWRMRAAIRAADAAGSKPERVAALRRVVDTYRPLAEGREYEWFEPYRETVRQDALDAAVALAEELAGQPTEQLAVLDAAISQHPYAEQLYQAAMRARAQLGHLDAIRALRRTLTRRLAEIDAEPADDTLALADQLTADLRRAGRDARTRRSALTDGGSA
ncbi:LysM peptidoglycan-binding domain-containing protein [Micromonospora sp. RHAY321]|uniref:BTAD domain-containing putative transcriptional regulator n=1 Tax=Micromonospora sp. RHAY321 TaxID=2944807 RepID=UPI00207CC955|nr:BTAD domain-containing putative transcriptional regulator [Micromonospora sp. RHAY321]MCO1597637.1 LysM peptidoglycan-binding domain-containing protein [Micromonospora sp. RHAY321]